MPRIYKYITAFLAFAGCISLVISGELNPAFLLPGLALIPGYYRFIRGERPLPKWAIGGLSIAALLVLFVDALAVSSDFFKAVAHMTIVFQAIKSFDLKDPWDHLQVYFMSLLQLVMTSELTFSIVVGVVFVLFLAAQIAAMVFAHFMKEGTLLKVRVGRPLLIISLSAFFMTTLFFVAVPRVKGGVFGRKASSAIKSVGFAERVDFGSFGEVLRDQTIVMRAELSGGRLPLYWRGVTLNHFDGTAWKDTTGARRTINKIEGKFIIKTADETGVTRQEIFIEPLDTAVVFGLGDIVAVESTGSALFMDEAGALFLPAKSERRFSYTVYSVPESGMPDMPVTHVKRYLNIPDELREGVSSLAQKAAGIEDDLKRAGRIEKFMRENYKYSLSVSPPPEGMTPIEDFLYMSKTGFCGHYATAMALMLRSVGIPSRIVTGFMGGEENDYGDYVIVRQSNAHSWVEALIDGRWRTFDPTPPAGPVKASGFFLYLDSLRMNWYRYIIGFSSQDQITLIRSFSMPVFDMPEVGGFKFSVRPVYVVLVLLASVSLVFVLGRKGGRRLSPETRLYLKVREKIRKMGGAVGPSSTPADVMREAVRLRLDKGAVQEFIGIYEDARFGGRADLERIRAANPLRKGLWRG